MRGAWHLYPPRGRWRRPRSSAWIVLTADGAEAVNFNGTSMRIVREAELMRDPRLSRLGPDLLSPEFTTVQGVRSLRSAAPETELGEALLDQTLIAGIGNIFKSEGCFAVGLDPWARLADLTDAQLEEVTEATRSLMLEASDNGRQPKRIYRRPGQPCPRCRATPIRSRGQGDDARTTYWCPNCQQG